MCFWFWAAGAMLTCIFIHVIGQWESGQNPSCQVMSVPSANLPSLKLSQSALYTRACWTLQLILQVQNGVWFCYLLSKINLETIWPTSSQFLFHFWRVDTKCFSKVHFLITITLVPKICTPLIDEGGVGRWSMLWGNSKQKFCNRANNSKVYREFMTKNVTQQQHLFINTTPFFKLKQLTITFCVRGTSVSSRYIKLL